MEKTANDPTDIQEGVYNIQNNSTKTFVDLDDVSNGADVHGYVYFKPNDSGNQFNQRWRVITEEGFHRFQNLKTGNFLELDGAENGAHAHGFADRKNTPELARQQWWAIPVVIGQQYRLLNRAFRTFLDLSNSDNGADVQGWEDQSYNPNVVHQEWNFTQLTKFSPFDLSVIVQTSGRVFGSYRFYKRSGVTYRVVPADTTTAAWNDPDVHQRRTYYPEIYDCDDFAMQMASDLPWYSASVLHLEDASPAFGFLHIPDHAQNLFIDESWYVRFFEPQNGQISDSIPVLDDGCFITF